MRIVTTMLLIAISISANAATVSPLKTTFDASPEGWMILGGVFQHIDTGGNPGGFIQADDNMNTSMTAYAPSKFAGDLSEFLGGTISFDGKNINGKEPNRDSSTEYGKVTIGGPAGITTRIVGGKQNPLPDDAWHTFSAKLTPADWTGDLEAVLADVTGLNVVLEFHNIQSEISGFDNFSLSTIPTPLPPSLFALGASLIVLGVLRGRCVSS